MKKMYWIRSMAAFLAIALCLSTAWAIPGLGDGRAPNPARDLNFLQVAVTGQYSLSVDGNGTLDENGVVQVNKPDGATVFAAYLFAASTGFRDDCNLPNGSVSVEGTAVDWDAVYDNMGIFDNGWADITTLVADMINAAPAGLVDVDISENTSICVDGEGIAVIFNDPAANPDNTIILLFGGQALDGDDFQINLAAPIDLSDPGLYLRMGLGISFSYSGGGQGSNVDVNGNRMSSSSGGFDDGALANGALFTVGGIGDDATTNPPDPNQGPSADERYDDEAYNLLPFVADGDQSILVHTVNPSNDDNILFAWLELGLPAALGESVILTPAFAANPVSASHELTASVRDDAGNPIANRNVTFEVLSGPNAGVIGSDMTDAGGIATISYNGTTAGIDRIQAYYTRENGEVEASNVVTKIWWQGVDMGDLPRCNYPTLVRNPGHGLSGIAWLGEAINGETRPNIFDQDQGDDGVNFVDLPWMPCTQEQVVVTVTAGPNYAEYARLGGQLYLSAWKDGNLDGDFCDELCDGRASEWMIQDMAVEPGTMTINVIDPGVFDLDVYDGAFRFRLSSEPAGRFGFGMIDATICPECICGGELGLDFLGEVEDYYIPDAQLAVNLSDFQAIARGSNVDLTWRTASEIGNATFQITRDGSTIGEVATLGNGAEGHTYRYTDTDVAAGTHEYTLWSVSVNGVREELRTVEATPEAATPVVTEYALYQNYPNPFNPSTTIAFDLVASGFVSLKVYNVTGQEVASVVNSTMSAGHHTVNFDATGLPSGLYIYKIETNGFSAEHKMLLMK